MKLKVLHAFEQVPIFSHLRLHAQLQPPQTYTFAADNMNVTSRPIHDSRRLSLNWARSSLAHGPQPSEHSAQQCDIAVVLPRSPALQEAIVDFLHWQIAAELQWAPPEHTLSRTAVSILREFVPSFPEHCEAQIYRHSFDVEDLFSACEGFAILLRPVGGHGKASLHEWNSKLGQKP
jgi:hypothetical protein